MAMQVITFLLWPIMIALSYFLCVAAMKRFEKEHGTGVEKE